MSDYKKARVPDKMTAFNRNFIVYILGLAFSLWGDIYLIVEEKRFSWILSIVVLACLILIFTDALYYEFTKKEMTHVHFWGYIWHLPWTAITSIQKHTVWDSVRNLPRYSIVYDKLVKNKVITQFVDVPSTKHVTRCIETYYGGHILGAEKKKNKKHR